VTPRRLGAENLITQNSTAPYCSNFSSMLLLSGTRNSAVAERPRGASCYWIFR